MRIVEAGIATVQDAGRPEERRAGVPPGGPLDGEAWALANAVVGNRPGAAAVELLAGTFVAELQGRVAVGSYDARISVDGRDVEPWTAVEVTARLRVVARTTTYVAVLGGIGTAGVAVAAGDVLAVGAAAPGPARALPRPPVAASGPLRVVAGPQAERFDLAALTGATWRVGPAVDRMGVRLAGPPLRASGGDLLPDGVVPGSLQVPPDGQPILLLADAPTTGGYPKVAVVASVDLGRAGRLRPGDEVAFELVSVDQAHALLGAAPDLVAASTPVPGSADLLAGNLVGGAVDVRGEVG